MKHPDEVPDDEKPEPGADEYIETPPEELRDIMDLSVGDLWTSTDEHPTITKLKNTINGLTLCDPTDDHPQSSRAGTWSCEVSAIYRDWYEGNIVPATLTVEVEEVNP